MADQEDEDLRMALRMSMQHEPPEPKRSKPRENAGVGPAGSPEESPEMKNRRAQRELMAAAAEKRMMVARNLATAPKAEKGLAIAQEEKGGAAVGRTQTASDDCEGKNVNLGKELSSEEADQLFSMVFGSKVTKGILARWSNQGIRFSPDPETSMGLVQHEGGPCGVLAAIQAYVIKHLLFSPKELSNPTPNMPQNLDSRTLPISHSVALDENFASLTEERKSSALVRSMAEILFLCGNNERAVLATLSIFNHKIEGSESSMDDVSTKVLEGFAIDSGSDLQKILRIETHKSQANVLQKLEAMIPVFHSRMGAMLFLISALLSRGLGSIQADRDDPSQPLVTAPFGHASQEIVNLLLCGEAVAHVFDGRMDLGGGMSLKGISSTVEVGFLTLLEALNYCKVGQYLKCPKWPIWVIGSESHYTVLFALDSSVQDENEFERREIQIRRAFDAQDQSGGGGFIGVEGFHQVLKETGINLPLQKMDRLCNLGFIVWSEFWQVLLDLDKSLGGLKDSSGLMGKKVFDLYHFNGIAKSDLNGSQTVPGGDTPAQRPRLTKLRVSVPPRWTPEEFMADLKQPSDSSSKDTAVEAAKPNPSQHAPLVDCIRTRWHRAVCNWVGDPPSIV